MAVIEKNVVRSTPKTVEDWKELYQEAKQQIGALQGQVMVLSQREKTQNLLSFQQCKVVGQANHLSHLQKRNNAQRYYLRVANALQKLPTPEEVYTFAETDPKGYRLNKEVFAGLYEIITKL